MSGYTFRISVEKWTRELWSSLTQAQRENLQTTFQTMIVIYPELQTRETTNLFEFVERYNAISLVYLNVLKELPKPESSKTEVDLFDADLLSFGEPNLIRPLSPMSIDDDPLATPKPAKKLPAFTPDPASSSSSTSSSSSSGLSGNIEPLNNFSFGIQLVPPSPTSKTIELLPDESDPEDAEYDEQVHDRVINALIEYEFVEKRIVGLGFALPSSIYAARQHKYCRDVPWDIGVLLAGFGPDSNLHSYLLHYYDILLGYEDENTMEAIIRLLTELEEPLGSVEQFPSRLQVTLAASNDRWAEVIQNALLNLNFSVISDETKDFPPEIVVYALHKVQWEEIRSQQPVAPTIRVPTSKGKQYKGKGKKRAMGPEIPSETFLASRGLGLDL